MKPTGERAQLAHVPNLNRARLTRTRPKTLRPRHGRAPGANARRSIQRTLDRDEMGGGQAHAAGDDRASSGSASHGSEAGFAAMISSYSSREIFSTRSPLHIMTG